jgi:hypothetical protein
MTLDGIYCPAHAEPVEAPFFLIAKKERPFDRLRANEKGRWLPIPSSRKKSGVTERAATSAR